MCEVVNSTLWKSLRVGLGKRERARLLRELRKAYEADKRGFILESTYLSEAFVWRNSLQGRAFWNNESTAHLKRLAELK